MAVDLERAWHPWSPDAGGLRLALALKPGMAELNALYPNRPQGAQEGTIGDRAHRAEGTGSDHNPNNAGVVRAWDIQVVGAPFDAQALANYLAARMRARAKMFGSLGYVIYNRRITAWSPWGYWSTYYGSDPHTEHIHLSLGGNPGEYDDPEAWHLALAFGATPAPAPSSGTATPIPADWFSFMDDKTFRTLQTQLTNDINNHVISYAGPRYVRFPKAKKNPSAVFAWDGSYLTWITAQDYVAVGSPHVLDVVDHTHSNIYRCPVTPGTLDPRK